ncbi:MAG: hypothetical protein DCE86_05490 [Flavobacteriaceae bacterium]|nr:MAG: hypothetical protein DCE86_05490 [Flavobacteriaceae bacterium]
MTHYYIDFGHSTATKNKPQHEAWEYLRKLNGKLIFKEDLKETQQIIIQNIKEIFERHPRCKALFISFSKRSGKSIWMNGFEAVSFRFEPAELVLTENLKSCLS